MSDQTENQVDENDGEERPDELTMLKQRATQMGLKFHPNIKLETLRAKVNAEVMGEPSEEEEEPEEDVQAAPTPAPAPRKLTKREREAKMRNDIRKKEMKLIRLRITNLNPEKREWPGEIVTVGNRYIGNVKKFIPFDETSETGYHVPYCIYKQLKAKQFLQKRVVEDRKTGNKLPQLKWVNEYALEVLPQLTAKELADLAKVQAAAGRID